MLQKQFQVILNAGNRVVILVGQGALRAGQEVLAVAEKLGAPIVKALLGKAVIPDDSPLLEVLVYLERHRLMMLWMKQTRLL